MSEGNKIMVDTTARRSASAPESGTKGLRGRLWTVPLRGLRLYFLSWWEIALCIMQITAISFFSLGIGIFMLPKVTEWVRRTAAYRRELARTWTGTAIAEPYLPRPEFQAGVMGRIEHCQWIFRDRATWRDLLWLLVDPVIGAPLALMPATLLFYGAEGIALFFLWNPLTHIGYQDWYTFVHVHGDTASRHWALIPLGLAIGLLGALTGPWFLRVHAAWTRALLTPTQASVAAKLARRVQHLTETRHDAVDTQAAELRRIERDLHDGAQARLVAMGMNLGAIEELLEKNPVAARALVVETRDASARALTELRDLVRGIHPPVLADRGLGDAVRALALDSALNVEVSVDLPGRQPAPIESAAYFAVSEVLTNAAKHSGARHVWIEVRQADGVLRLIVTDDGAGGADAAQGTGLRGIERRLATFDGILALSSPIGGPTIVTMELPCA